MARNPELLTDVDYEDVTDKTDPYFTAQGGVDKNANDDDPDKDKNDDDWSSEADTVTDDADDIQARPVSSLGPKDQFTILQRWW